MSQETKWCWLIISKKRSKVVQKMVQHWKYLRISSLHTCHSNEPIVMAVTLVSIQVGVTHTQGHSIFGRRPQEHRMLSFTDANGGDDLWFSAVWRLARRAWVFSTKFTGDVKSARSDISQSEQGGEACASWGDWCETVALLTSRKKCGAETDRQRWRGNLSKVSTEGQMQDGANQWEMTNKASDGM